eukprot:5396916-Pyramimonas_sp.AAC.1
MHGPNTGSTFYTVELTVKTLLARLITGEFNSPANSPIGPASPLVRTEDDMHGLNTGSTFYTVE